jgi:hypothetical protein
MHSALSGQQLRGDRHQVATSVDEANLLDMLFGARACPSHGTKNREAHPKPMNLTGSSDKLRYG